MVCSRQEISKDLKLKAEKNGIGNQDFDLAMASGALNQIMYKYETESFFRTKSCAGIQLLSIQDYPGQGEALGRMVRYLLG